LSAFLVGVKGRLSDFSGGQRSVRGWWGQWAVRNL